MSLGSVVLEIGQFGSLFFNELLFILDHAIVECSAEQFDYWDNRRNSMSFLCPAVGRIQWN